MKNLASCRIAMFDRSLIYIHAYSGGSPPNVKGLGVVRPNIVNLVRIIFVLPTINVVERSTHL